MVPTIRKPAATLFRDMLVSFQRANHALTSSSETILFVKPSVSLYHTSTAETSDGVLLLPGVTNPSSISSATLHALASFLEDGSIAPVTRGSPAFD
jgi:hypothetical protein